MKEELIAVLNQLPTNMDEVDDLIDAEPPFFPHFLEPIRTWTEEDVENLIIEDMVLLTTGLVSVNKLLEAAHDTCAAFLFSRDEDSGINPALVEKLSKMLYQLSANMLNIPRAIILVEEDNSPEAAVWTTFFDYPEEASCTPGFVAVDRRA